MIELLECAIAQSQEIQLIDRRLDLLQQQQELLARNLDHHKDKRWTAFLTLDPIEQIQNIFGGGERQERQLEIDELEIRGLHLAIAEGEMRRRRAEIEENIHKQVIQITSEIQSLRNSERILEDRLATHRQQIQLARDRFSARLSEIEQQIQLAETAYRNGDLSTPQMLDLWNRPGEVQRQFEASEIEYRQSRDRLRAQLGEIRSQIQYQQNQLGGLCNEPANAPMDGLDSQQRGNDRLPGSNGRLVRPEPSAQ
jgi:hypothetical protein